jgi:hypothetical protein
MKKKPKARKVRLSTVLDRGFKSAAQKLAKKRAPREDFSQAAARIVREATDKV